SAPGLASFSPFMGVMLQTVMMQLAPDHVWVEMRSWLTFWVAADAALAVLMLLAVLVTFDRCLGGAGDPPARPPDPARPAQGGAMVVGAPGIPSPGSVLAARVDA